MYTDAFVTIPEAVSASEDDGSVELCIDSGIIGSINTSLSLTMELNDGKAGIYKTCRSVMR